MNGGKTEPWLPLLVHATNCWFMIAIRLYRTRLLVYLGSVCKWIELLLMTYELNCSFPDNADRICSTNSKQVHFSHILSFLLLLMGGRVVEKIKHLKTIIKSRHWKIKIPLVSNLDYSARCGPYCQYSEAEYFGSLSFHYKIEIPKKARPIETAPTWV